MIICPDAEPDDGLFDVLTIGDLTKRDLLVTLPKTYRGAHLPHPKAELLRGAVVTSTPTRRCRSSSTASSRARRRCGSRSSRARCGCACPRPRRGGFFGAAGFARPASSARRFGFVVRRELLLELRHPLLERVEAAELLLHLVEPRLRVVHHVDDLRAARDLRQLVQRLVAELRDAGRMSFCLVVLRVLAMARIVPRHARTVTGVPARVRSKSRRSSVVADADAAGRDGLPDQVGPVRAVDRDRAALRPAGQHLREGRDPDAPGPNGPDGSAGRSRWLT